MMTLFSGRLNTLLAIALAAWLALGAVSAFAGPAPDDPGDAVTVDTGDGDTEGDTESGDSGEVVCGVDGDTEGDTEGDTGGDADCDADGDAEGDADGDAEGDADGDAEGDDTADTASHDGQGPNPDRGCANGSLDHAREVLAALLERDHPGENEGIQNALDKMCHAGDTEGSGGEVSTHSGNGHAFGHGHGHGKP